MAHGWRVQQVDRLAPIDLGAPNAAAAPIELARGHTCNGRYGIPCKGALTFARAHLG